MFLFFSITMLLTCVVIGVAQDSTAVANNPIIALVPESWYGYISVLLLVYEFIVRIYPTTKNYSIVNKIVEILAWIDRNTNKIKSGRP
jgi:hypothetical protein